MARRRGPTRQSGKRRRTAKELRESERRFQLLVDGALDYAMFMMDRHHRIIFWSKGAERIFGWSAAEAVGRKGDIVFTPEDLKHGQVEKEIAIACRDGRAPDRRWHQRKDGSRVWVDGVLMLLPGKLARDQRGFAKVARDATEERNAQDALEKAHDELERRVRERTSELLSVNKKLQNEISQRKRLEREILRVTEREKRRIGQDIHDSLCQELTAAAFFLQSMANKSGADTPEAAAFREAAQIVNANVGLARDLARGLHPVELSSRGLMTALRELCFRVNGKVLCRFDCSRPVRITDETLSLNLYRIAQEAVNNSLKHGKPHELVISLRRDRSGIELTVQDDGTGLRRKNSHKGMGIHIMTYRARVIGGNLSVESQPGHGTLVTCRIPIRK